MKTRQLLVGLAGTLVLGSAAGAEFVGLGVEFKDVAAGPDTLVVCNVFMRFNDPLDRGYAVAGTPSHPMSIAIDGGGMFYEHPLGTERPPDASLIPLFPSLAYDTFVTMGTKTSEEGFPPQLSPGFPQGPLALAGGLSGTSIGWFVVPTLDQVLPDPSGNVVIAQLSIDVAANPDALGIVGTMLVQWDDWQGNTYLQVGEIPDHPLPAPGAAVFLALAAAPRCGARRRPG